MFPTIAITLHSYHVLKPYLSAPELYTGAAVTSYNITLTGTKLAQTHENRDVSSPVMRAFIMGF